MKQNRRKFLKFLLVSSGILTVGKILGFDRIAEVKAWDSPNQLAPLGNTDAPINMGTTSQTKQGNLTVQGTLTATNRFKVPVGTDLFD
jgi:hypothetical protein